MKWVVTGIDFLVYALMVGLFTFFWLFWHSEERHLIWRRISEKPRYIIALMVLVLYGMIGFLDCIHLKTKGDNTAPISVLDAILSPLPFEQEVTYSAPFALKSASSEIVRTEQGTLEQVYPKLKFSGQHLQSGWHKTQDILIRMGYGVFLGLILTTFFYVLYRVGTRKKIKPCSHRRVINTFFITLGFIFCVIGMMAMLMLEYHILGTDKIGRDVFYMSIKSIRTGLVIGTVTTLVMLPFALLFGMLAGFFRGWVDGVIQYTYTTLSSIPGVLLITAAMLSFQARVQENPDLRLLILCAILGLTSWTTLCRLLRAESLKIRSFDFILSAIALGVTPIKIISKHIMPNLIHIVIITVVLDFSGLVLAETVLSYVGVGVDPTTYSWGNMINASRLELAHDPMIWWSLSGALFFMFCLVFSANVFSDALQEGLNPRTN